MAIDPQFIGIGRRYRTPSAEMRRVTWPTRAEVIATTWVVVLFSAVIGTYLWGLDVLFDRAVRWAFKALGAA